MNKNAEDLLKNQPPGSKFVFRFEHTDRVLVFDSEESLKEQNAYVESLMQRSTTVHCSVEIPTPEVMKKSRPLTPNPAVCKVCGNGITHPNRCYECGAFLNVST